MATAAVNKIFHHEIRFVLTPAITVVWHGSKQKTKQMGVTESELPFTRQKETLPSSNNKIARDKMKAILVAVGMADLVATGVNPLCLCGCKILFHTILRFDGTTEKE